MKKHRLKKGPFALAYLAEEALQEAVRAVIRDHARTGDPLVIWRDGKVVRVSAARLLAREPDAKYGRARRKK